MTRQPFYPFRSEQAKTEYEAYCLERAKAWPVASETMVLDTPSGKTLVRVSGRPTDPPLILLPGARVSSLMWIDSIAALSARHRTYALDIIGDAGFSVNRRKISKPGDFVTWLDEVLTVLVPEGALSLMGISLGGVDCRSVCGPLSWAASERGAARPSRDRASILSWLLRPLYAPFPPHTGPWRNPAAQNVPLVVRGRGARRRRLSGARRASHGRSAKGGACLCPTPSALAISPRQQGVAGLPRALPVPGRRE